MPGKGTHIRLGEDRLQRSSPHQPEVMRKIEEVVAHRVTSTTPKHAAV
jgi:hypothetical protein